MESFMNFKCPECGTLLHEWNPMHWLYPISNGKPVCCTCIATQNKEVEMVLKGEVYVKS